MRLCFIANPLAGGGRGLKTAHYLGAALANVKGVNADLKLSKEPGHAESLAKDAVMHGCDRVIAVGGDGTLHEVVNGILSAHREDVTPAKIPAVGLIPSGTGNDFARGMGLSRKADRALETCLAGTVAPIDLGFLNGRAFVNVAGFGFDAQVAREVTRRFGVRRGATTYLLTALRELMGYKPSTMTVEVDGQRLEHRVLLGAVGNATTYGGGMRICPNARVDDGLLDLCLVRDLSPIDTVVNLARVFLGRHVTHPKCTYVTGTSIRVTSEDEVPVHVDGQMHGSLPADFTIRPCALKLVTAQW